MTRRRPEPDALEALTVRVRAALEEAGWRPRQGLVVACSGGSDSMALLLLCRELARRERARIVVAHLDHGLRGEAGAADARWVETRAREAGLACVRRHLEAGALASKGGSLEQAAREARYDFLLRTARDRGCAFVATAHHREDAAETFLLRLLRGSGRAGLSGLPPCRPLQTSRGEGEEVFLVRPLLETPRAALRRLLEREGWGWREDSTNEDLRFDRNRLRRDVVPLLESFAPGAVERIARAATILADEEELLEPVTRRALEACRRGSALATGSWRGLPASLRARVLRLWIREERGHLRGLGSRHLFLVADLLQDDRGALDLPGTHRVRVEGGVACIRSQGRGEASPESYCYGLSPPGQLAVPTGQRLEACVLERVPTAGELQNLPGRVAVLDAEAVGGRLHVRSRRPGDRVRPLGLGGHSRKIKDVMLDAKLPVALRDRHPLVEAAGEVAWVAGLVVAEPFRIRPQTRRALRLELKGEPEVPGPTPKG